MVFECRIAHIDFKQRRLLQMDGAGSTSLGPEAAVVSHRTRLLRPNFTLTWRMFHDLCDALKVWTQSCIDLAFVSKQCRILTPVHLQVRLKYNHPHRSENNGQTMRSSRAW